MAKKKKAKAIKKRAKVTKKTAKKAAKKATRKTAKKITRKAAKKAIKKAPAKKKAAKAALKPKLPRRTKAAAPPPVRVTPPPVVDVTPMMPPPSAPAAGSGLWGGAEPAAPPSETGSSETPPADHWPAGPQVGDIAPEFQLPDETGRLHLLSQYRGQKVILYFYPKDDTPGCTTEACGFRDILGTFTDRDAVVLGVSPDSVASHQRFVQKYNLTFPLLADEGHAVSERYGVWVEKVRYGQKSMGIARTTFVVDPNGRVAHIFRNVRPEGHEREVLAKL